MALPPIYDPEAVKPMEDELHRVGIKSLRTPEEVDAFLAQEGTSLIVLNSVCGCAAGGARPGAMLSLQSEKIPSNLGTVFAGVDRDAVEQVRAKMPDVMPSSPCIAVFKDGAPVHVLERRHIETMDAMQIANNLAGFYESNCEGQGPSISKEEFSQITNVQMCGSKIPIVGQ